MAHLYRRECFDVQIWIESAQPTQELEVPILFQCRMETTHHVHFSNPRRRASSTALMMSFDRLFERNGHRVFWRRSAELAGENTDIGVIDVAIQDI